MAFTYDQLKTAIQDYTQNSETSFVTNLPVFIRGAEERILKTVQLTLFRKNSTGNMSQNIIGPTPDSAYAVELHYYYRPASLTAGAGSAQTWLSENAELTLLYGCLIEAYVYMKGDPTLMQEYEQRYMESLTALKQYGEAKEVTDEYRTGMVIREKA